MRAFDERTTQMNRNVTFGYRNEHTCNMDANS